MNCATGRLSNQHASRVCFGNNRGVANDFVTEVEEACESTARAVCNTKTKLVEAKLEMVRTGGLF
jgi:hypothetical protein